MNKPKLENISIRSRNEIHNEIQLDWSNDRHQAVVLKNKESDSVIEALQKLVWFLQEEKSKGMI